MKSEKELLEGQTKVNSCELFGLCEEIGYLLALILHYHENQYAKERMYDYLDRITARFLTIWRNTIYRTIPVSFFYKRSAKECKKVLKELKSKK
ncbi:MAG: hypothetical protein GYA51_17775 [Candidatus Methanofastidiosa archaeon]|nr:hypothetical protein [Candidatus Methanofastidiosa archaeon]